MAQKDEAFSDPDWQRRPFTPQVTEQSRRLGEVKSGLQVLGFPNTVLPTHSVPSSVNCDTLLSAIMGPLSVAGRDTGPLGSDEEATLSLFCLRPS